MPSFVLLYVNSINLRTAKVVRPRRRMALRAGVFLCVPPFLARSLNEAHLLAGLARSQAGHKSTELRAKQSARPAGAMLVASDHHRKTLAISARLDSLVATSGAWKGHSRTQARDELVVAMQPHTNTNTCTTDSAGATSL
jgi:hypothetical protein